MTENTDNKLQVLVLLYSPVKEVKDDDITSAENVWVTNTNTIGQCNCRVLTINTLFAPLLKFSCYNVLP